MARYTCYFSQNTGQFPNKLGNNGRDISYGGGLKAGLHHQFGDHFSVGFMYQTQIRMGSNSKYSDFLAGAGELNIPSWIRLGFTWKPVESFSFSIDAQQIRYSEIRALSNSFGNIYDCPGAGLGGNDPESCLGGKRGAGFAWKDVPVYNFGASWALSPEWTLMAGMSISDQPVPANENFLNSLLINLNEAHYTAGFTRKLANGHEIGFSFMYSEEESIEWPNQLDASQRVLLTNDQFDLEISYSWDL